MKPSLLLLSLAVLACTPVLRADDDAPIPQISVTGTAEREYAPDYLEVMLDLRTESLDLETARSRNDATVEALRELVNRLGLPQEEVRLSNVRFGQEYDYSDNRRRLRGYYVQRSVRIELRQLETFGPLLQGLTEIENLTFQGMQYQLDDLPAKRAELRLEALQAARDKAQAMTAALGMQLLAPLSISEMGEEPVYAMRAANVMMESSGGVQEFDFDKVKARVSVQVTFEMTADR